MSSIGPTSASASRMATDPSKHVNYVLGMVLGVDDFTQEFTYLSGRNRWLVRDLLGSGTAWGLAITRRAGERGPEVAVSPGVAVSPQGQLIRVTSAQCASLDDWLSSHQAQVDERLGSPPSPTLTLHVALRYSEKLIDSVPIPGEPCRTEDQVTAPSRLQDNYLLDLLLAPPAQTEEDAQRGFVQWLRTHLQPVTTGGLPLADFLQALRQAFAPPLSASGAPHALAEPAPPDSLPIPASLLPQYMRAALRLWITELRPAFRHPASPDMASGLDSAPLSADTGDAVLLATLRLPLTRAPDGGPWRVVSLEGVVIEEESRPLLVPLRMVQEWSLATSFPSAASGGGAPVPEGPRITAVVPSPAPLDSELRIQGENFDALPLNNAVTAGGLTLTPSPESTASTLFVVIPSNVEGGAPPPGTTRSVSVTVQTPAGTVSASVQVSPPLDIPLPAIRSITPPEAARGRSVQLQSNILRSQLQYPFLYQNIWISFFDPVDVAQEQLIWAPGMSPHLFDDSGVLTLNLPGDLPGLDAVHTPLRTRVRLITQSYTSGIVRISPAFDYSVHYGL